MNKEIEVIEFVLDDKEIAELIQQLENLKGNVTHIHMDIKEKKNIALDIAKKKSLLIHNKRDILLK
ncbi:hypothetical protein J4455_02020 [Candidatus Woesearchaeota archaeon]|nr:hypothetical protein [Candidatus Woesearchaeota archaeon]